MAKVVEGEYREALMSRHERLRCEAWVTKLSSMLCGEKVPFLKNRNNYMRLLQRCILEVGALQGVFRKLPPDGGAQGGV